VRRSLAAFLFAFFNSSSESRTVVLICQSILMQHQYVKKPRQNTIRRQVHAVRIA
jgi:hypothetical protein